MLRFYYGSGSPFAWRVHLALEEKGIAYEPVLLSFDKGEHKTPEHLARSPHGKVPALEHEVGDHRLVVDEKAVDLAEVVAV